MEQNFSFNRVHILLLGQRIAALLTGICAIASVITAVVPPPLFWLHGVLSGIGVLSGTFLIWDSVGIQRSFERIHETLSIAMQLGGDLLVEDLDLGEEDKIDQVLLEQIRHTLKEFLHLGSAQEIIRNQTNLVALQNQINPHFLYDTLDVIRSEAIIEGADNASDMIETLSRLFRYGISTKEDLVTVAAELKNVQDYFRIQQYRFMDRYLLRIETPDQVNVEHCLLPKLTLQPLVENAILHAFRDQEVPGTITIRLDRADDILRITVSDDGRGMDRDTLCALRERIGKEARGVYGSLGKNTTGIALENINKRIHLFFGENYGLYVYSLPRVGTDIVITVPGGAMGEEVS